MLEHFQFGGLDGFFKRGFVLFLKPLPGFSLREECWDEAILDLLILADQRPWGTFDVDFLLFLLLALLLIVLLLKLYKSVSNIRAPLLCVFPVKLLGLLELDLVWLCLLLLDLEDLEWLDLP